MIERKLRKLNQIQYLIVVLIILLAAIFYVLLGRSVIKVQVTPTNAIVTVDNRPIPINRKGNGSIIIKPGDHAIKIEADGYITQSEKIKLKKGKTVRKSYSLDIQPDPVSLTEKGSFLSQGKNKDEILYLDDKTLYRSKLSVDSNNSVTSSAQPITDSRISRVNEIIWSPNKDLALFRKDDGVYLFDFQRYDFVNQTETLWGKDIGSIAWSPDDSKIAYFYRPANGERTLIFSNVTNSQPVRVANLLEMGIDDPILRWSPDSEWLIVIPRNKNYSTNKIYLFNSYSRTFSQVTENGSQIDAVFSPNSKKIIYTTYLKDPNNSIPFLVSAMDLDGSNKKSLDIRTSLDRLCWINDSSVVFSYADQQTSEEVISTLDVNTKEIQGISIRLAPGETVKTIIQQEHEGKKIISYETANSIFAIKF